MTIDAALSAVVADAVAPIVAELRELRAKVDALRAASPPMLMSVQEYCRRGGISPATAWRRIASKELPVQRIGRSVRVDMTALRPTDPATVAALAMEARR
jgi:predicted DNA-binding transcriptional regulator AlpA